MTTNTLTTTDAPIDTEIVSQVATNYDVTADELAEALDALQADHERYLGAFRDSANIVYETESYVLFLDNSGQLWNEAQAALDFDDELREAFINAHNEAVFAWGRRMNREQEMWNANADRFVLGKPERDIPTDDFLDETEWSIEHNDRGKAEYHYSATAHATVTGEYGTLSITRTYRALPGDNTGEPREEIVVTGEATHVESDTLVNDDIERYDLSREDWFDRTVDEYDPDLKHYIYMNHTADFAQEYRDMRESIPLCEECGAYPDGEVDVRPRPMLEGKPTLDNHCFAAVLDDLTSLSRREAEVYALKHGHLSHREIGERLGIAKGTVDSMAGRIKNKRNEARWTAEYVPSLR